MIKPTDFTQFLHEIRMGRWLASQGAKHALLPLNVSADDERIIMKTLDSEMPEDSSSFCVVVYEFKNAPTPMVRQDLHMLFIAMKEHAMPYRPMYETDAAVHMGGHPLWLNNAHLMPVIDKTLINNDQLWNYMQTLGKFHIYNKDVVDLRKEHFHTDIQNRVQLPIHNVQFGEVVLKIQKFEAARLKKKKDITTWIIGDYVYKYLNSHASPSGRKRFDNEMKQYERMQKIPELVPHIPVYKGHIQLPMFGDKKRLFWISYLGDTVSTWLTKHRDVWHRAIVLHEIRRLVQLFHKHRVYHGDLHLGNVVVNQEPGTKKYVVKLIDFDLSSDKTNISNMHAHRKDFQLQWSNPNHVYTNLPKLAHANRGLGREGDLENYMRMLGELGRMHGVVSSAQMDETFFNALIDRKKLDWRNVMRGVETYACSIGKYTYIVRAVMKADAPDFWQFVHEIRMARWLRGKSCNGVLTPLNVSNSDQLKILYILKSELQNVPEETSSFFVLVYRMEAPLSSIKSGGNIKALLEKIKACGVTPFRPTFALDDQSAANDAGGIPRWLNIAHCMPIVRFVNQDQLWEYMQSIGPFHILNDTLRLPVKEDFHFNLPGEQKPSYALPTPAKPTKPAKPAEPATKPAKPPANPERPRSRLQ